MGASQGSHTADVVRTTTNTYVASFSANATWTAGAVTITAVDAGGGTSSAQASGVIKDPCAVTSGPTLTPVNAIALYGPTSSGYGRLTGSVKVSNPH